VKCPLQERSEIESEVTSSLLGCRYGKRNTTSLGRKNAVDPVKLCMFTSIFGMRSVCWNAPSTILATKRIIDLAEHSSYQKFRLKRPRPHTFATGFMASQQHSLHFINFSSSRPHWTPPSDISTLTGVFGIRASLLLLNSNHKLWFSPCYRRYSYS
jgi:hypothetical protein